MRRVLFLFGRSYQRQNIRSAPSLGGSPETNWTASLRANPNRFVVGDVFLIGCFQVTRCARHIGLRQNGLEERSPDSAALRCWINAHDLEFGESKPVEPPSSDDVTTAKEYVAYFEEYGARVEQSPGFPFDF
jgi:hypothetical protein